jgi:sterol desaturase/sphingolipid hydroxylase (fatty acid hydroxylase superfamily)
MLAWVTIHSQFLLGVVTILVYFVTLLWETFFPRRVAGQHPGQRWLRIGSMYAIGLVFFRFCFPFAAVALVVWAQRAGIGVFNQVAMPAGFVAVLGVVLLDLGQYGGHRLMHRIPLLWRFHRVHHSDQELDCVSDLLHHPGEFVIAGGMFYAQLLFWGFPYETVILDALLGAIYSPLQHGNLAFSSTRPRWLRHLFVTPEMHSIPHSTASADGGCNFSSLFPWWDNWFRTRAAEPHGGWSKLRFGLPERQRPSDVTLVSLLLEPMRRSDSDYNASR